MPSICPVCDGPLVAEDYSNDNVNILRGLNQHVVCPEVVQVNKDR